MEEGDGGREGRGRGGEEGRGERWRRERVWIPLVQSPAAGLDWGNRMISNFSSKFLFNSLNFGLQKNFGLHQKKFWQKFLEIFFSFFQNLFPYQFFSGSEKFFWRPRKKKTGLISFPFEIFWPFLLKVSQIFFFIFFISLSALIKIFFWVLEEMKKNLRQKTLWPLFPLSEVQNW